MKDRDIQESRGGGGAVQTHCNSINKVSWEGFPFPAIISITSLWGFSQIKSRQINRAASLRSWQEAVYLSVTQLCHVFRVLPSSLWDGVSGKITTTADLGPEWRKKVGTLVSDVERDDADKATAGKQERRRRGPNLFLMNILMIRR